MSLPTFSSFFEAVWGHPPFPWQEDLAERVLSEGWPDVLDIPTGAGKTAALDIALYHLVVDGGRRAPRRIVLVVDRRVIVDQVASRARRLVNALHVGAHKATRNAASALRAMIKEEDVPLLQTAVLRGATLRDDAWAHRPHVPVLAASTVDQVGSRLLFRGYGVSDGMRPVHAGLLGCDTLLLLDEVHLARPFADVLGQLQRLRGSESEVPRRFHVVQLSATPGDATGAPFRLGPKDRTNRVLARRLAASKPAKLERVKVSTRAEEGAKRTAIAAAVAEHARAMIEEGRSAVAVVVNRVDTARRACAALSEDERFETVLVTGRMRPLDQQRVLEGVQDRVLAGREVSTGRPVVLVATQCIEAGADFDFDGLVTECASLDALRQRFGRLDRRGDRSARAVILARSDLLGSVVDPVYGTALARSWEWLDGISDAGNVDFGIDALQPHLDALGPRLKELLAPSGEAPAVVPAYLDQWAQTNPRPHADPDVSLFLHGIPDDARSALADVQVVWRADVSEEDLAEAVDSPDRLLEQVAVVPPGALEALSLPLWAVQRWLAQTGSDATDDDLADVDGLRSSLDRVHRAQRVLVWHGYRARRVVTVDDLRPGSLVIVPAARGGIGAHKTFEPECIDPVEDLGDAVQILQRGRPTLRLDPAVYGSALGPPLGTLLPRSDDDTVDMRAAILDALDEATREEISELPRWLAVTRRELRARTPRLVRLEPPHREEGDSAKPRWVAVGRALAPGRLRELLGESSDDQPPTDVTTDGEEGSFTGVSASLVEHLAGVGEAAERFGEASGLPVSLIAALRWAGRIHDIGKVDRRFQLWLYGGDEVAASIGSVLAKSNTPKQDAFARRRARERAGYASDQRHELVSLDMAERSQALRERVEAEGADWDLVLHLVASHHGWCRPVAPAGAIPAEQSEPVVWIIDGIELEGTTAHERGRMDSGVVERFWTLVRRYGWHELAYLEAVLRLADHRRSALEQHGGAS